MRNILLQILILLCCINRAVGQKIPLDIEASQHWPVLNCENISNNGKYFSYTTEKPGFNCNLRVEAIDGSWKEEFKGVHDNGLFTANSQYFIFYSQTADSIGVLQVGGDSIRYFEHVSDFKAPDLGDGRWLACKLKHPEGMLLIVDLLTGHTERVPKVVSFLFGNQGQTLATARIVEKGSAMQEEVVWHDLVFGKSMVLGNACGVDELMFDNTGSSLAFLANDPSEEHERALYYFRKGMDSAEYLPLINNLAKENLRLAKIRCFDKEGKKLFVYVQKLDTATDKPAADVNVQGYNDEEIQRESGAGSLMAVVHLTEKCRLVVLQKKGDKYFCKLNEGDNFKHAIVVRINPKTVYGNQLEDVYLVSVSDGTRRLVASSLQENDLNFSLGGKYVIWYDRRQRNWYSYNMKLRDVKCITNPINEPLCYNRNMPENPSDYGIAGWLENDKALLIYSRYDIWWVDPEAKKEPVNLSGGYGKTKEVELRWLDFHSERPLPIKEHDTLQLIGFDFRKKSNIFFTLSISNQHELGKLCNDGKVYYYSFTADFPGVSSRFYPLKARDTGVYIVRRMSTNEYPNFYSTANFKSFKPLTDYQPQREYNWYSTELIKWPGLDGRLAEGILFKPENFDSRRRYPIIFYYYERSSDALNLYIGADLCNGSMNIPWFVSNGYLVFVPNIEFTNGHPGQAAYNAVVSAVKYFSKMGYVDVRHMGLQGHSYGAFETNYIVSHTSIFAAASASSGMTDLISDYGSFDRQYYYEKGQGRIGSILWEKRDLYIENSPIFNANKVNTPVLIMHNKRDPVVRFTQGEEWFNALSRQGKKVWLLSYNSEGHTIWKRENQIDYTTRLTQFFGYYLKGESPPKWMGKEFFSQDRGGVEGLKLDFNGSVP